MITVLESKIKGCFEIYPKVFEDQRGIFIKTFHKDIFQGYGLATNFVEYYYSISYQHVIRGLHFQTPPMENTKLVYCTDGEVLDVAVDLRKGSPTFGDFVTFHLSSEKANMIYIPEGIAHGFSVRSKQATMIYHVTSMYSSEHDQGIRYDSLGIDWGIDNPIVSQRDQAFPEFQSFHSPFIFHGDLNG